MIIKDAATVTKSSIGEITYSFKALDFPKIGRYFVALEFTVDNTTFTLPGINQRIEIIVG